MLIPNKKSHSHTKTSKSISFKKNLDENLDKNINVVKERFNFFVENAEVIITIINNEGVITYQTPSIKKILGYSAIKRIGINFITSKIVHNDDRDIKLQLFDKARKNPNKIFTGELRLIHKNNQWRWMEVVFNNQLNNPYISGIVISTRDITRKKELETQKDEYLNIVSHELKTPLTVINTYTQLLLKRMQPNSDDKKIYFLHKISEQSNKIVTLVRDLSIINNIEAERLSIHLKPFHLPTLIKKIIVDFHYTTDTHKIEYTGNTHKKVFGDKSRIEQVLVNLLTNAIKYSPINTQIMVRCKVKNMKMFVSIQDNGPGISKLQQARIFQRYYRIHNGTNPEGLSSGLGLYISSEIIKRHNGKIWVESKKGKGSTFYFTLPIKL